MEPDKLENKQADIDPYKSQPGTTNDLTTVPTPPLQPKRQFTTIIITVLAALLVATLSLIIYLLAHQSNESLTLPNNTTSETVTKESSGEKSEGITTQIQQAIKAPQPLQEFSYQGWLSYPENEEILYYGATSRPPEDRARFFGDISFSFPSQWRFMSGTDTAGIASRHLTLGNPDDQDQYKDPYAVMSFGWWPVDNTNGFEDTVVTILNGVPFPGTKADPTYTYTLREIGTNDNDTLIAIIEFSQQRETTGSTYRGFKAVIDNVRPAYPSSDKVSLASSHSMLAADPYRGAKEILSILTCGGDGITDAQLNECIGIVKSYGDLAS